MSDRQSGPLVTLSTGAIRGVRNGDVDKFLGIPYAASPLGERRFTPPVHPEPWSGVRSAIEFGPTAPQPPYRGGIESLLPTVDIIGDDFLNVNIWAPAEAQVTASPNQPEQPEALPVMVWVHGGSLAHGSNALGAYDGTAFARDGVVLVSLNYRLGAEGFSVLDGAPLNLGLADQLFALQWVQREIHAFGGDPARVTVFGQSAGGNTIAALLASPEATGLFTQAIIQSGPLTAVPREKAARITRLMAKDLGVPATAEAFRRFSPDELIEAQNRVTAGTTPITGGPGFAIAIGEELVPCNPLDAFRAGAGRDIRLLIGSTTEEYRLWFIPTGLIDRIGRLKLFVARLALKISARVVRLYRSNRPGASAGIIFGALATDLLLRVPLNQAADARSVSGAKTWVYEFAWSSPQGDLGAAHALELGFVFDTLGTPDAVAFTGEDAPQALADEMHRRWVDFATTGDPGWDNWSESRPVFTFDAPRSAIVRAPRDDERAALTR
ncbi:MAG: carboxylesterase/lipase family protein [Microbacteriaceae bacterium]|nr:carboxylesterase/lipase family protein [Microbacteriaceae bacterium]